MLADDTEGKRKEEKKKKKKGGRKRGRKQKEGRRLKRKGKKRKKMLQHPLPIVTPEVQEKIYILISSKISEMSLFKSAHLRTLSGTGKD